MARERIAHGSRQPVRSSSEGNIHFYSVKAKTREDLRCETSTGDTVHAKSSTDDRAQNSQYYPSKQTYCDKSKMGETSNPFAALITLICRTAKKSVNKLARIRRRKPSSLEEPKKQVQNKDQAVTPTLQPRSSSSSEPEQVDQKFNDAYQLHHLIGQGGFAMVYSAQRARDGLPVAIKVIPKCNVYSYEELDGRTIPLEIYLHKDLHHPNIVRLYDFFEYSQAYVMVLERPVHHKDLFDYITEKKYLSEHEAREIFRQVVEAAMYCESKGVFHRDIKDENVLLDTKTGEVKLFDFGSGSGLENVLYTDYEGTRAYCPPEWFRFHRYYARPATVWSLGILLYNMIVGDVPFSNEVDIVRAELHFSDTVSSELQDLIRRLLVKHPSHRISLDDVREHPWLRHKIARPRTSQFTQQQDRQRYARRNYRGNSCS